MLIASFKEKVFIPYITAGDPCLKITLELLITLSNNGAKIIELGIPFSDPSADGAINQASFNRALQENFSWEEIFSILQKFRGQGYSTPIIFFGYLNPFLQFGIEQLAKRCEEIGVAGILILDLPFEYSSTIQQVLQKYSIDLIYLITPTTEKNRLRLIANQAKGFVYCVARNGVTGKQTEVNKEVLRYIEGVKRVFSIPVVVGFGVCTSEQVKKISKISDGVVIGSFLVEKIERNLGRPKMMIKEFELCTKEFVQAIKN